MEQEAPLYSHRPHNPMDAQIQELDRVLSFYQSTGSMVFSSSSNTVTSSPLLTGTAGQTFFIIIDGTPSWETAWNTLTIEKEIEKRTKEEESVSFFDGLTLTKKETKNKKNE